MSLQTLFLASLYVFPALVLVAALRDLASYTIPNWISAALVASFVPVAVLAHAAGVPLSTIGFCVLVGAGALVVVMVMFTLNWVGGGDAKLLAACALWVGLPGLAPFLLWTAVVGGVLSVALLAVRNGLPALAGADRWYSRLLSSGEPVPYGVAIAIGALAAFPEGALGRAAHLPF